MGDQVTNYFLVKVEFETVNETTGKPRKIKTQYLVDSMTCTEAEARTHQYLNGTVLDYEIVSAVKSQIEDVIKVEVTA
jgi:hypothetical protein